MNVLTIKPDRLERLRGLCLGLPETSEKEAWGDPTWRVNDRIFAVQKGNYAGGRPSVWFKVPSGTQVLARARDPVRLFVPPYVGSKGWLGYYLDARIDWTFLAELIEGSYRAIAPKRLSKALDEAARAAPRGGTAATHRRGAKARRARSG